MTWIPRKLTYISEFGFVPMSKVILVSFLLSLTILLSLVYIVPHAIKSAEAAQEPSALELSQMDHELYVDPLILKQQKIVAYIKDERPEIVNDVANKLADAVMQNSWKYNIPIEIQLAIARRESRFDQYALGKAGELGFFQILPRAHVDRVFRMLAADEISNKNIYDPYTNASLQANILHSCLERKKHNMAKSLACYNGADSSTQYAKETLALAAKIRKVI
jgi:soluble lytic murein transglycosylase-like protein